MEYLSIVDGNNNLTGETIERSLVHEQGFWHREVAIWIINENREILIQKRSANKIQAPNKWETCAGHVAAGDNIESTVIRELEEELGIKVNINDLEFISVENQAEILPINIKNYIFQYMYFLKTNMKIEDYKIQEEEVSEIKYIPFEEFKKLILNQDLNVTFSKAKYMGKIINEIDKRINSEK